ncbi:MAG: DUF3284 domain-containing protein [Bifidobacteriaceae bacterium]|jgi:hypothetical protein|nr:DUF3284 domain-containing protein [Bifidobacteriaceae bacterium]
MKVTRHIEGDYKKCWKVLMEGFINDVAYANGKHLKMRDIVEGYTYTKRLHGKIQSADVKVTLTKLVKNELYEASFYTRQGINTLSYTLVSDGEASFDLIYEETFQGNKASTNANHKLMSLLYSRSSKKRINKVLDKVQSLMEEKSAAVTKTAKKK